MSERQNPKDETESKPKPGSGLTRKEQQEVRESVRHRAAVIYEIIRRQGETELARPLSALFWSAVAAGISIGFSFVTEAALAAYLPHEGWANIVAKLGYSVGFLMVILGHQQLFTENVLTAVLPVIARPTREHALYLLRLWGIVLGANLVGCLLFSLAFAKLPIASGETLTAMTEIVNRLMQNSPFEMFARGIGAGWLIAALVWILAATEGVEFAAITLLTFLIALFGFTHVVAGSAEALFGVLTGEITLDVAIGSFFLPTLLGNVFGGTVLFSVLSYAQVREEIFAQRKDEGA